MKSKYGYEFYIQLAIPIFLEIYILTTFLKNRANLPVSFIFISSLVILLIYVFPYRKEFKQVIIKDNTITFKYLFGSEKIRHFNEYDGYIKVNVPRYKKYIYLVKDHWKEDSINLDLYKNDAEILETIQSRMKYLGEKDVNPFTHFLFGGGPIDYNKLKKRNNEN